MTAIRNRITPPYPQFIGERYFNMATPKWKPFQGAANAFPGIPYVGDLISVRCNVIKGYIVSAFVESRSSPAEIASSHRRSFETVS